ncbi:hypothetical protein AN478_09170 [Thiohalorhabdus denitrificans]|nr:hypothetical protein [Thiohalorhabdus denitrificans]KPV40266.1 hypothetical protein AN478_09170 [Thiohalorhabdus denitrificans]
MGQSSGSGWGTARILRGGLARVARMHLRTRFSVHADGREHCPPAGPVLVVSNHRRDSDGPLVGDLLLGVRAGRFGERVPHFVAREDLFRKGFLREYLTGWPAWARGVLGSLDSGPVLSLLNVHPMRRVPERTLGEVLEEIANLEGDLPLARVLRPSWVGRFEDLAPRSGEPRGIRAALAPRYRPLLRLPHGLRKLNHRCLRHHLPREREMVAGYLQAIRDALAQGEAVHLVPEGRVSPHGGADRVRSGLHLLLERGTPPPVVLPLGITHDDATTARPRVFLSLGAGWVEGDARSRRARAQGVQNAILAQTALTLTQVGGAHLVEAGRRGRRVTAAELEERAAAEAGGYHRAGARVDPVLLDPASRAERVAAFIAFGRRHGLLHPERSGGFTVGEAVLGPPHPWRPAGRIPYGANEHAAFARHWAPAEAAPSEEAWAPRMQE